MSAQALQILDGERMAAELIRKVQDGTALPDELSLLVAPLYGAKLRGLCRAITKELEARHA